MKQSFGKVERCALSCLYLNLSNAVLKHLIYAQVAQDSQRKGKSGVLVDPRTGTVDGVIQLTPQLISETFEQYPVVAKAYSETVPSKVFGVIPSLQYSNMHSYGNKAIRNRILDALLFL